MESVKRLALIVVFSTFASLFFIHSTEAATTIEMTTDGSENLIDIRVRDDAGSPYNGQTQMKWNMSIIPSYGTIRDSNLCLYIFTVGGAMDDDVTAWRVDDQTWDDGISAATYDGQSVDTQSDTSINSTTLNTYTCFNVTDILAADHAAGNANSTIRFEDPDSPHDGSTGNINNAAENGIGSNANYFELESGGNNGVTGKIPVLSISYDAPGIMLNAYDEMDAATGIMTPLSVNITISNSTHSATATNQTGYDGYFANGVPSGDVAITLESYGYQPRQILESIDDDELANITAYMIQSADALYVRFHIINKNSGSAINDGNVLARRNVAEGWSDMEERETDASGVAALSLSSFATYNIIATAPGYITQTQSIQPSNSDYYFYMETDTNATYQTLMEDITWDLAPTNPSITPNISYEFRYDINNTNSTLEYYSLNITYNLTSSIYYVIDTTHGGGGNLSHDINTSYAAGNYTVVLRFKKIGWDEWNYSRIYSIRYVTPGAASIWSLLTSWKTSDTPAVFLNLVAIFIAFLGAGMVSRTGIHGGGYVAIGILLIFTFMGWFSWQLMILTTLTMLAVTVLRREL